MAASFTNVPAKCPECGRLTVDNKRHCKPDNKTGNATFWAEHCQTITCRCGCNYNAHGHYPRKNA